MIKIKKYLFEKIKKVDILTVLALLIALGITGYMNLEKSKEMNDSVEWYIDEENRESRQGL